MSQDPQQPDEHREASKRRLPQFRISTLLMAVALCALAFGWWKDRSNLQKQLDERDSRAVMDALAIAESFKQHQWRISDHLSSDTATVERALGHHLKNPAGDFQSSSGWGETYQLRKPSPDTFRQVIALLENDDDAIRHNAAKALALYGEGYYAAPLYGDDRDNCDTMIKEAVPKLLPLLDDSDADIRATAALALGQLASHDDAAPTLIGAFKREDNSTARLYMSWAIQRLF